MGWANAGEKRERILRAAESCLKARGLDALNIRDVAREAGVSLGSVHYYFSGKDQILMEIFQGFVRRVSQATLARVPGADPRQVMADFLDGFFAELEREPYTSRLFLDLWQHVNRQDASRRLMESYYRGALAFLTGLIRDGKRQGLFRVESPALAAAQIIALIDGIKVQAHLFGDAVDARRMKKACRQFIGRALAAP